MTLTEFLLARIAEDEAVAHAVPCTGSWAAEDLDRDDPAGWEVWEDGGTPLGASMAIGQIRHPAYAHHIARFDPVRVLAECEAKRRIVETDYLNGAVLRHLAAVHADHPDYRDEWRP